MTQIERLNCVSEKSVEMLERLTGISESTHNVLDNFQAQRTFHADALPPVNKYVRAVYRRFNGESSFIWLGKVSKVLTD